jgi:uncharacterized protein (DUF58 family)
MRAAEEYLKPEVIRTVSRLDLRARFIIEGFLSGLHASPYHGFSVEFSEHRRYSQGDDPKDIDWLVYAKTDRYYVKKYQAETNITGYLMVDLSESMGYTFRQNLTKLDYAISLAAALGFLMIRQQDPVGLLTFDDRIRQSLPARSRRTQLANILAVLARSSAGGPTEIAMNLRRTAALMRHRSLMMLFSDLLAEPEPTIESLRLLKHAGHDIIVFHILDEAEVTFPFGGMVDLKDPETGESLVVDADGIRADYIETLEELRGRFRRECLKMSVDYVPLDTSMPFDRALVEYLSQRKARF